LIAIVWFATACGGTAPEVGEGADPALSEGRSVWVAQCASCHGAAGGGGRGPKLSDGQVLDRFPDVADQIDLVLNGRGAMPSYAGRLSDEQIESVVRYTREVLAVVE
jgi:cytochrome c oxidase subunit 2